MCKILLLIDSLGAGGAERQLTGLAVMLAQQGFNVEVCYFINRDFYLPYLKENKVKTYFLPKALKPQKRFGEIRKHIKVFNPDAVISFSSSPSMIACVLKMLGSKFNLIVSERNTTQKVTFRVKMRFFLYRWANHIVPNSHSQANFIVNNYPSLSLKMKVITNFVDINKFAPSNAKQYEHEDTRIICVGSIIPQKNIMRFSKAITELYNKGYKIHVDWYGQNLRDAYAEEIHHYIVNNHLEKVVEFHNPTDSIQDAYICSDVFCLPSIYEGFPNVLCEAMSCGKPVLCSRVCDNPNIVCEGENGYLFDPYRIEDMVSTMEHYLSLSNEDKVRMGKRSREIAETLFSDKLFLHNFISIL